jgi:hypothetical protein
LESADFSSFASLYNRNWYWSSLDLVALSQGTKLGVDALPIIAARDSFHQKADAEKVIDVLLQTH